MRQLLADGTSVTTLPTGGAPAPTGGAPFPTGGAPATGGITLASFVDTIVKIINTDIIPVLFALAFLFFLAGMARYIYLGQGSEEGRQKGKKMMLYGIIGFVVLFGIWGIINFFVSLLSSLGGVSSTQSSF